MSKESLSIGELRNPSTKKASYFLSIPVELGRWSDMTIVVHGVHGEISKMEHLESWGIQFLYNLSLSLSFSVPFRSVL